MNGLKKILGRGRAFGVLSPLAAAAVAVSFSVVDASFAAERQASNVRRSATRVAQNVAAENPIRQDAQQLYPEIVADVNDQLAAGNEANMFVTAWIGVVDVETGELEYVNCGHLPPVLRTPTGALRTLDETSGPALAALEGAEAPEEVAR